MPTGEDGDQGQSHPRTPRDTVPPPRQLLGFAWAWCLGTACHVLRCGYTSPSISRLKFPLVTGHRFQILPWAPLGTWSIPLCSAFPFQPLQAAQQKPLSPVTRPGLPGIPHPLSICLSICLSVSLHPASSWPPHPNLQEHPSPSSPISQPQPIKSLDSSK